MNHKCFNVEVKNEYRKKERRVQDMELFKKEDNQT